MAVAIVVRLLIDIMELLIECGRTRTDKCLVMVSVPKRERLLSGNIKRVQRHQRQFTLADNNNWSKWALDCRAWTDSQPLLLESLAPALAAVVPPSVLYSETMDKIAPTCWQNVSLRAQRAPPGTTPSSARVGCSWLYRDCRRRRDCIETLNHTSKYFQKSSS